MSTAEYPGLSYAEIREFSLAHPEMRDEDIGHAMTRRLRAAILREFAAAYVAEWSEQFRRAEAREAERRATTERATPGEADERTRKFEQWLASPQPFLGNARERVQFRKWAGDRFGEWYQRGRAVAREGGGEQEQDFEADWHDGGTRQYHATRSAREVMAMVRAMARDVRLETTRELLETVFAAGDGTEISWGAATVEQHARRIELLAGHAGGTIETAVRHQAAIDMIRAAGVRCLSDVASLAVRGEGIIGA